MLLPTVFLDIDGVLNSDPFLSALSKKPGTKPWWLPGGSPVSEFLDPLLVVKLNPLVGKVRFVASTSYRKRLDEKELTALLQGLGFRGVIEDKTPWKMSSYKCNEIGWFLADDPRCEAYGYVILDDDDCSYPGHDPFIQVQTQPATGLTDADVAEVARILGVTL